MISDNKRLALNSLAMFFLGISQRVVGLLQLAALARLLDVRGLGAVTFMQSTAGTFAGISRFGTDAGLHVELARLSFPDDRDRAEALIGQCLTMVLAVVLVVVSGMLLLAEQIATRLYSSPNLMPFVVLAAAMFAGQSISQYFYAIYAGLHAFALYTRVSVISSILSTCLTIGGALGWGAWGGAFGLAIGQMSVVALLALGLRRELGHRGVSLRPQWPSAEAKSVLILGLPFYGSVVLVMPAEFATLALLSSSAGVESLGELRVTQALMSMAAVIPASLSGPMVSHLVERQARESGPGAVLTQLKVIWILALLISILIAALWPFAIDLVFGPSYQSARVVGILGVAGFVSSMLLSVLTGAMLAAGKRSLFLGIGVLHASALILAAWALIDRYGLAGMLIAQAIGWMVASLVTAIALIHHFGCVFLRPWMLPLALFSIVGVLLLGVDVMMDKTTVTRISVALSCLFVFCGGVITIVLNSSERTLLLRVLKRSVGRLRTLLRSTHSTLLK